MRRSALLSLAPLLLLLVGCAPKGFEGRGLPSTAVKAPGNLPVRSPEQLADEARSRAACAEACTGEGDARASCVQACLNQPPMVQVEIRAEQPEGTAP